MQFRKNRTASSDELIEKIFEEEEPGERINRSK